MQVHSSSKNAYLSVSFGLTEYMLSQDKLPIIVCIGCDRVVGDSLAPIVGDILKNKYNLPTYVYGDLDYNITAQEIKELVCKVKTWHPNAPIVVIDATLGKQEEVGVIKYYKGGCYPAAVYGNNTTKVGDYCILGVVDENKTSKQAFLCGITMQTITELANVIAMSVATAFKFSHIINYVSDNV